MTTDTATRCRACGAFRLQAAVCPVCQQFDPPVRRSAVVGAAVLGLIPAGLMAGAWAAVVERKWYGWLTLFGRHAGAPERADALTTAVAVGLLLAAGGWVAGTAFVLWAGGRAAPPE